VRTCQEIDDEIRELKSLLPRVFSLTRNGEDNRAALNAMIRVLEEQMSDDQVDDEYGDGPSFVYVHAMHAAWWLRDFPLSEGWPLKP